MLQFIVFIWLTQVFIQFLNKSAAASHLQVAMAPDASFPFRTVDVPDHAHYTIGSFILAIGITGMIGNFLVIYAFSRYTDILLLQNKVTVFVMLLHKTKSTCC